VREKARKALLPPSKTVIRGFLGFSSDELPNVFSQVVLIGLVITAVCLKIIRFSLTLIVDDHLARGDRE